MKRYILLLTAVLISHCAMLFAANNAPMQADESSQTVLPKREMRAAWIATVANIDWPSREAVGHPDLQRQKLLQLLDSIKALNMNMVIFQIRPTSDALYRSELEPWSHWLTGKQGEWPAGTNLSNPDGTPYDPLTFICTEAHKRCIDVHVWLNPYRVTNGFTPAQLATSHIYRSQPELFVKYGKQYYFDPGYDQTRQHLCRVVADVVRRYDIDGIHFDDYFYPYRIAGEEFPDEKSFRKFPRGYTNKDDWRRHNVDMVIQELHDTIKTIKPWVEFGISPFGVWRNSSSDPKRGSATQAGVQNYDDLYADILLWLEKGWIDYVVPQLYWEIGKKVADYAILAHWWAQYTYGQNLYIGHSVSGVGTSKVAAWNRPNEICRQIRLNRTIPEIQGSVFFPIHTLLENRLGLCDSLRNSLYRTPALLPSVGGQPALPPTSLKTEYTSGADRLSWQPAEGAARYVVYAFPEGAEIDFNNPDYIFCITTATSVMLPFDPYRFTICVTSLNRYHSESLPAVL